MVKDDHYNIAYLPFFLTAIVTAIAVVVQFLLWGIWSGVGLPVVFLVIGTMIWYATDGQRYRKKPSHSTQEDVK